MKTLHLFAGAGGGLLADLILGHEPIAAVEWDHYCCRVLRERAAEGWFHNLQVFEGDVRMFDASAWAGRVDCIHAGFPCQPHSVAGKRQGEDDERNLWPDTARVIGEIRPPWVFLENVPGLVSNRFIGVVLRDLAVIGYDARWTLLGADQAGAPHRRERWWCLGWNADYGRREEREVGEVQEKHADANGIGYVADSESGTRQRETPREAGHPAFSGQDVADADGSHGFRRGGIVQVGRIGSEGADEKERDKGGIKRCAKPGLGLLVDGLAPKIPGRGWWEEEPDIGRVAQGVPERVAKLKALGNGQVPIQAALAWLILSYGC